MKGWKWTGRYYVDKRIRKTDLTSPFSYDGIVGPLVNPLSSVHILHLPKVIVTHVLNQLDPRSVGRCMRVCKQWRKQISDGNFFDSIIIYQRDDAYDHEVPEIFRGRDPTAVFENMLLGAYARVKTVHIHSLNLAPHFLRALENISRAKTLSLTSVALGPKTVADENLDYIALHGPLLEEIQLYAARVTDPALDKFFRQCPHLRKIELLTLDVQKVTSRSLACMFTVNSHAENVTMFWTHFIESTELENMVQRRLNLGHIRKLGLSGVPPKALMKILDVCPSLQRLRVPAFRVRNPNDWPEMVFRLNRIPKVKLAKSAFAMADDDLLTLSKLTTLHSICVEGSVVVRGNDGNLTEAPAPVTLQGVADFLAATPSVRNLGVCGFRRSPIKVVQSIVKRCRNLQRLWLEFNNWERELIQHALPGSRGLEDAEEQEERSCFLRAFAYEGPFHSLKSFEVVFTCSCRCSATDAGLVAVARQAPKLEVFRLDDARFLTLPGIKAFIAAAPNLKRLELAKAESLSDRELALLASYTTVEVLIK